MIDTVESFMYVFVSYIFLVTHYPSKNKNERCTGEIFFIDSVGNKSRQTIPCEL